MTLTQCIDQIIKENFRKDDFFDSHAVINELLKDSEYHKAYLDEYSKNLTVAQWHGMIAQMIGESDLVKKCDMKIKTHTIYGELSENQVWQRE